MPKQDLQDTFARVSMRGVVASDPEIYTTRGGKSIVTMRVMTREQFVDNHGVAQERDSTHVVVVVGAKAANIHASTCCGHKVDMSGNLRTSIYDGSDGKLHMKVEVIVTDVMVLR